jgi:hypothetical protein
MYWVLSIVILSYPWFENRLAFTQIPAGFLTYLVAFLVLDFAGYWSHRVAHEYNIFWNSHIIHHSSEEFNLACALRQSISSIFKIFTFLLVPAALLGVPGKVIATVAPLHLFAQFWYHTRHIGKMGWLEYIIVTPSHHRVHHAINPEYLDRNYSQIFIFWDKLFGTFQQELSDVPPVYGITRPVKTWNPIKINFLHLWQLIKDAWMTKSRKDKMRIWVMPTGWRPEDVAKNHPLYKIEDVYHFEKYRTDSSQYRFSWACFQMICLLLFISYLFGNIAGIGSPMIFVYGTFVFLTVYAYTEFMDGNPQSFFWELAKNVFGISIIVYSGDWFGVGALIPWIKYLLLGYFIGATTVTGFLVFRLFPGSQRTGLTT